MCPNASDHYPDDVFFHQSLLSLKQINDEEQVGLAVIDNQFRFIFVNDEFASFNHMSSEQHRGRIVTEVESPLVVAIEPKLKCVLAEKQPVLNFDLEIARIEEAQDIHVRFLSFTCYPLQTEDGEVFGVVSVVRDITQQKVRSLEHAELRRFEAILTTFSATFINLNINDVDQTIERSLKSINRFLGFDRVTVWQFSQEDGRLYLTHSYVDPDAPREGILPPPFLDDVVPVWVELARKGEMFFISRVDELPDNQWREKIYCHEHGEIKSILFIPLSVGGNVLGVISFVSVKFEKMWPDLIVMRLRLLGEIIANVLERKRTDQKIQQLKNRLEAENLYLRDQIDTEHNHESVVGQSERIKRVLNKVEQVATTDSTVLILGETGTGKELVAHAIHNVSARRDRAMIKLNCAALPSTLIESELFGREKGAFTGASARQIGRFEAADGSTIFLDEVGELPLELQSKLLRVLQEGQFERLGNPNPVAVDVRVIAATNRDLRQEIKRGTFREDLFYRLNVFPIEVPPLRDRREDVPLLVWSMVKEFSKTFGKTIERIPKKNMDALQSYAWPGNIRELRNLVERAMILSKGPTLLIDLPEAAVPIPVSVATQTLAEVERAYILSVLERCRWRVRGKEGAADILGLKPTTLEARMKKLEIGRR